MKYCAVIFALTLTPDVLAEKLISHTFEVAVKRGCGEGHVTCDNVAFELTNKHTGTSSHSIGKTLHSKCSDGVTPCKFQGYTFMIGDFSYILYARGSIEILNSKNEIVTSEQGEWHY